MNKVLLLIAAVLIGIGLIVTYSPVMNIFAEIDTGYIQPLTDEVTPYTSAEGNVPTYNAFDQVIVGNLQYIFYLGAAICVIIMLGQARGGSNE